MSFDKKYPNRKDHRQDYYTGSKRFDRSCRPHGNCGWCESNRKYNDKLKRTIADEAIREFYRKPPSIDMVDIPQYMRDFYSNFNFQDDYIWEVSKLDREDFEMMEKKYGINVKYMISMAHPEDRREVYKNERIRKMLREAFGHG